MSIDLRSLLTGATIRTIAGIVDLGESLLGIVDNISGGAVTQISDARNDIWVHVKSALEGRPRLSKLLIPANMLFRVPRQGETVMVVRGQGTDGPGSTFAMHGVNVSAVPQWLSESRSGISVPETVVVESTQNQVELGAANLGVTDGLVHGSATDPFTGATYYVLGSTTEAHVRAKK